MKKTETENKITPVVATIAADLLTPLAVFLKLSERGGNAFLLESVEGGRSLARYSFIGANSDSVVSKNDASLLDDLRQHFGECLAAFHWWSYRLF
jgi:anthranilate/para-aminobenzoate synthase component I